jgi:hypothetical protein
MRIKRQLRTAVLARIDRAVAIAALVLLALVFALALLHRGNRFSSSGAPFDIQLAGVRPDASDDILDGNGKKLREDFFDGENVFNWEPDNLHRDFIFDVPTKDRIEPVGVELRYRGGTQVAFRQFTIFDTSANRKSIVSSVNLPRIVSRSRWVFPRKIPVEFVDILFRFFTATRETSLVVFNGPFEDGVTNKSAANSELVFDGFNMLTRNGVTNAQFRASTALNLSGHDSFIFYDRAGQRHFAMVSQSSLNTGGTTVSGFVPELALDQIASVSIDRPHERIFRHVRVRYPDRPPRAYPEFNDRLAAKLAITNLAGEQIGKYEFHSAEEALSAIEILRGPLVEIAANTILNGVPGIDFARRPQAEQKRIRRTAWRWATAHNLPVRLAGVHVGLKGQWPEFIGPAVDVTAEPEQYMRRAGVMSLLVPMAHELTPEQINRIKDVVLRGIVPFDGDSFVRNAVETLRANGTAAASTALVDLCADTRPWIWSRAASALGIQTNFSDWPDIAQQHWIVAHGDCAQVPPSVGDGGPCAVAVVACARVGEAQSIHVFRSLQSDGAAVRPRSSDDRDHPFTERAFHKRRLDSAANGPPVEPVARNGFRESRPGR